MEDAVELVLARRRRRQPGRLPALGIAAALGLHVALTAMAVLLPRLDAAQKAPLEFVAVRIVPAQALGKPEPPPPRPEPEVTAPPVPEPEVVEPEPEPQAPVLPEPEPKKPEPSKPDPKPEAKQPPVAAPSRPASPDAAPQRQGSPAGSPTGTAALGPQVATVGDPDFTYGYYLDRVLAAIEANWRRPPTDGVAIEVVVDFRIQRDGTVRELDVAEPSGLSSFDLAGLRAVQAASPLPPLPAGYRKSSLAIRLIIR